MRFSPAVDKRSMVKKKVDSRIRTLIENGVKQRHRTLFVIVGTILCVHLYLCSRLRSERSVELTDAHCCLVAHSQATAAAIRSPICTTSCPSPAFERGRPCCGATRRSSASRGAVRLVHTRRLASPPC